MRKESLHGRSAYVMTGGGAFGLFHVGAIQVWVATLIATSLSLFGTLEVSQLISSLKNIVSGAVQM